MRRILPLHSLQRHTYCTAAAVTEPSAALSGTSRASRVATVSIQRFLGGFPPAISADYVQKLQQLHMN